jgi:hypothetical protein
MHLPVFFLTFYQHEINRLFLLYNSDILSSIIIIKNQENFRGRFIHRKPLSRFSKK